MVKDNIYRDWIFAICLCDSAQFINKGISMRANYIDEKVEAVDGSSKIKRYKMLEVLGEGSFSKCWKVNPVGTDKLYAMKILPKKNMMFLEQEKLNSEIRIHQSLSHPNIVFLQHSFEDQQNQYIYLEYCQNKTLEQRSPKYDSLEQKTIRYYGLQILSALKYLHRKRILHRDLKLSNCFINSEDQIKIGDFGFACKLQSDEELKRQTCGTPNFLSPEVAGGFGHSFPSDVWSFGVILFRLKFGICPFEAETLLDTVRRIKTADYTFSKWVSISSELKDLIQKIFQIDYDARPTIEQIEMHPFFGGELCEAEGGQMKKTSSLKGFIQRLFSKQKKEVDKSMSKTDSCKNLREMKTILRDKTQQKQYSTKDSTIKDDRRLGSNPNSKLSTLNTPRGGPCRYDEATSSYYTKLPPETKPSKVLSKQRTSHPSVTQYFPHFLIYNIDLYDECTIIYLTNGLRQIFKDREIYIVFNGRHVVDKHGSQINEIPRLVDYICREKMKESIYKPTEQSFKEQVNRRNFITKWKTVQGQKLFTLCNATVLTTTAKSTYYLKSDYCECLYNSKLEIVINESLLAKCKLSMLDIYSSQTNIARQKKFLD